VLDDGGQLRAFLRRDGAGLRVVLMNYALEEAFHRPLYLIRSPEPRPGVRLGGACSLRRADGAFDGSLRLKGGLRESTCSLEREGKETLVATRSNFGGRFEVRGGARVVASGPSNGSGSTGGSA
jgi:hypothetical protein